MPTIQAKVFEAAHKLPKKSRAQLAKELLDSLEDEEVIEAHIEEANRKSPDT